MDSRLKECIFVQLGERISKLSLGENSCCQITVIDTYHPGVPFRILYVNIADMVLKIQGAFHNTQSES